MLRLSDLTEPSSGLIIEQVTGPGMTRLLELGITPGTRIDYIRSAPLRFPVEIKVRGFLLTLRKAEADGILLRSGEKIKTGLSPA